MLRREAYLAHPEAMAVLCRLKVTVGDIVWNWAPDFNNAMSVVLGFGDGRGQMVAIIRDAVEITTLMASRLEWQSWGFLTNN